MSESKIGVLLPGFAEHVRRVAAEGVTLLKNEGQMLPLVAGDKVSLFGRIQVDYYRSGTGSGGAVNVPYKSNLLNGLRSKEQIQLNEELAAVYEAWVEEHPFDNGGGGWAMEPWFQAEMPLTEELVASAKAFGEKAVYVIGRTAGEDKDNVNEPGGFLLTETEKETLRMICSQFDQVAVLLNTSNIIDMNWLNDPAYLGHIKAVAYVWQGGIESGNGAADALNADVIPSGKLPDTIARVIEDYPATPNFGNEDVNLYQEDIYVGYRYFETFAPEKVMYPFGYGIGYTTLATEVVSAERQGENIVVSAKVTNTGSTYAGKEVLQVYYGAPQGQLGRPVKELGGFVKTSLLQPGESEVVSVTMPLAKMAAFDDGGYTGHKAAYVLEAGDYVIYAGTSVKDVEKVLTVTLEELQVVEQLEEALAPSREFKRMKPGAQKADGTYEIAWQDVPTATVDLRERINSRLPAEITPTGDQGYVLKDVESGKITLDQFVAQLSDDEMATLVRGEGMCSPKVTPGTAGAFGGVGDKLLDKGIPLGCCSDGPSGIRMDNGAMATQVPIGALLASTWDLPLVEELYILEGQELCQNEIDTLLGPGINIHRHPLNGRNFEYFSEDPFLTGQMASANVRGLRRGGSSGTMKHYACNNQEFARRKVDSVVSERAVREIYLKGFEIAVKEGGAVSIMTSYNPINGHWAASNYDLVTTILRGEWGYTGMVMTDWWAMMNDCVEGGPCDIRNTAAMVRAQNDLFMLVNNYGAEVNGFSDNTLESLENGKLTRGELQRSAKNILNFLMNALTFTREINRDEKIEKFASAPVSGQEAVTEEKGHIRVTPVMEGAVRFVVKEGGVYSFSMNGMYQAPDTAQSAVAVQLNGKDFTTVQMTGSFMPMPMSQKLCRLELESGEYELTCHATKPGMTLIWLGFDK